MEQREQLTDRQRFDVIFVGDVATNTYLALSPDWVQIHHDASGDELVMPFGAKLPYEGSFTVEAGGNAADAAVCCSRLGLRVALASYLGADQLGRDLLAALHAEGVNTSLVRLDQNAATSRHFVLWLGCERTILIRHEQYEYQWPHLRSSEIPAWLYLSSVGRDGHDYENEIADWLEDHPSTELAFAPGTYQINDGPKRLARLYKRSNLLVCNREEAALLAGTPKADIEGLLGYLLDLGPRQVVITDAASGAYAADEHNRYSVPIYPDTGSVVDRTGAGDAFASTLLAYIVRGMSLEEALLRAPVNAMSVVHAIGSQAGLLRPGPLDKLLADAPSDYVLTRRDASLKEKDAH
jgi:sugar/nucleoside kinase (ribokinase family)